MIVYVDVDGVICNVEGMAYRAARPIRENIDKINALYDAGHHITYWTARGRGSGIDWSELTSDQLKRWGCKYHVIDHATKPIFDLIIDNDAKRIEEL